MESDKEVVEKEKKTEDKDKTLENVFKQVSIRSQILDNLAKKELDPFDFLSTSELNILFDNFAVLRLIEENEISYSKWLEKRGKDFNEVIQQKTKKRFLVYRYLDELVRTVLGHYGILGSTFLNYRGFALSTFRTLENAKVENWKGIIQSKIRVWSLKYELNEEALKVLGIVVAKFTARYLYEKIV